MMTRPAFNIRFFTWVVQHPWLVIALTILWTGALGFHLKDMSFDPDSRVFFSATNPQRIALDKVENTYNKANNVLFVLAPKNGDVFTKRTLELVEELTDRAWRMPSSFRVDSIANFSHTYARGDDLIVEPLYKNASAMSDADIARTRGLTLGNKELVNRLISAKGDVTAVSVLVNMHDNGRVEVPKIALWSRELAKELGAKYPDVEFRLTGGVIADETFAEAGNRDLATLTPVMLLMIFVALWAGLRTFGGTVATMFVVVLSVVVALGIYVGTGTILNGATAGAPVIIMTVSILDSAHIIRATGQQLRTGLTKEQAIVKSLELNNMAIFVTSFTDVIGFMTLNFAESPPLIELGNIVTVGVVAAYILSMTFLPALLAILPAPPAEDRFGLDDKMARIARYIILHRRKFLVSTSVVVVLMSAGIYRITLDDDFIKYFSKSYDFRNDTEFLQERLGGLHVINFSIASGEEQGVTRPDYLATIDKFAAWYRQQPNVVHVASLADTMKRLNKNLNGDDPAQEKVPESRNLAAQMLLLYEMSLPFGHDLRGQLDVSRSSSLVTVWVRNVSSSDIKRLGLAGEEWLRKNAPNEMHSTATGLSMAYAYISEANIRAMLLGTLVALSLISFTMLIMLRNLRISLVALIPNLVPVFMAFGLWGFLFGEVNLAVSVVGSFTFGIVVDDTTHILTKYLYARRKLKLEPNEAMVHVFESVGSAMVLTSITLVAGFVVLTFSGFAVSYQMGFLSAITILIAAIVEVLLLPPIVIAIGESRRKRKTPA